MRERRNVPEIAIGFRELLRRPKLGSISSLQCQKSRTRVPWDATCEVMFSRTISLLRQSARLRSSSYAGQPSLAAGLPSRSWLQPAKAGGARRDRTDDLMLAKHALSQLSYGPVPEDECICCARLRWSYGAAAFFERTCRVEAQSAKAGGPGKT
jgi:hypothetical protein